MSLRSGIRNSNRSVSILSIITSPFVGTSERRRALRVGGAADGPAALPDDLQNTIDAFLDRRVVQTNSGVAFARQYPVSRSVVRYLLAVEMLAAIDLDNEFRIMLDEI